MSSFEAKHFVASDSDIRELAADTLKARSALDSSRSTYLKVLIGTAQAKCKEIKAPREEQLRIARSVHKHFFAIVEKTVLMGVKQTDRSREQQRRTNFARTASSTLNSWLKVETNDLMTLKPAEVTKASLRRYAAPKNPHKPTSERTEAKMNRHVSAVIEAVRPYVEEDVAGARLMLEHAIKMLQKELKHLHSARVTHITAAKGLRKKAA